MWLAAALSLFAGSARAADRSDPIPASVGPPGGVGFYVNPSAPGLDPARVQEIVLRSLQRWGDTFLGLTTAQPGAIDGTNVIGVGTLPSGALGVTQTRSPQTVTPVAATRSCVPTQRELTDKVTRRNRALRVSLRRDAIVGRRLRRRSVRRTIRVPTYARTRAAAVTQLCTLGSATSNVTAKPEIDVVLQTSPGSHPWQLGPALPTDSEYDFETNALHELGHVSGLAHQIDECDPSTPMPVSQSDSEYWHAVDEWLRPDCAVSAPPAPAPAVLNGSDSTEPLPGAGATTLAGMSIHVNPRVPAGYDAARFVAVATRAIRRAGGTPVDVADVAPTSGDGVSVLGFASLGTGTLSSVTRTPRRQVVEAYGVSSCRRATRRVRRQIVVRRVLRRRGLRLRRDVVQTRTRSVRGFACTKSTRPATTTSIAPEIDLRINQDSIAWELGPKLPTDGTRWDLETAVLQDIMTGLPRGSACDATTPNTSAGVQPGDWWRSTTEVRRTRCESGTSNSAASTRRLRSGGAATTLHLAGGLPADVRTLP